MLKQNDNLLASFLKRKINLFLVVFLFSIPAVSQKRHDSKKHDPKKSEATKRQLDLPKTKRFDPKPDYSSGKSLNEEPLRVQKDLVIPQRSGNVYMIQKKVLKEVGASDSQIEHATDTGASEDHSMD